MVQMALELLIAALGCFAAGAVAGGLVLVAGLARYVSAAAATAGSILLVIAGIASLSGDAGQLALPVSTPLGGFELRTEPLSGLFLLLTGLLGTAISIYSSDYSVRLGGSKRRSAMFVAYCLTLSSLAVLLAAGNALTFLVAWEAMSILTYLLVALEYDHAGVPEAAFLMLALGEIGFVAMTVAFALIGGFGTGRDFAVLASSPSSGAVRDAAFVLFLFGFGAKAGLLPLQGWLPEAHPAAPSNISALLSAVVVKMAVYGLILSTLVLLGPPPVWWGYLALAVGVVTAFYGVLFSLLEHDLKRALAFSTVENLGFIVTLIGAALIFRSLGKPMLEALALVAATLHALNHGLLKGVLFLGAGSVQSATGTRDMDALGGLWRRMRWTAPAFLIGAAGLAGLPPLNGFQSEWLGLQTLLQSHLLDDRAARIMLAASGALIALTFGLAVTTYVRIMGGVFLGAARTPAAEQAVEAPLSMRAGMSFLAVASVVLGLLPPLGVGAAAAAASRVAGVNGVLDAVMPPVFSHPEQFPLLVKLGGTFLSPLIPANGLVLVPASVDFASIAPTYIFITLVVVIALVAAALRLAGARGYRESKVWAGAIPAYLPSMQYTATAFTNPLRFIFGGVYQSERHIEGDYHQAPFFARSIRYTHRFIEPVQLYLYEPIAAGARALSERMAFLQAGSVSLYLLYMFAVFLLVLFIR
jgi:hydrogenase-4 component B